MPIYETVLDSFRRSGMRGLINPVLILTHNNIEMNKRCYKSVLRQDVPSDVLFVDNGSTDGTSEWIVDENADPPRFGVFWNENKGVSFGWNYGVGALVQEVNHVIVLNSDSVLAPWSYSLLLS